MVGVEHAGPEVLVRQRAVSQEKGNKREEQDSQPPTVRRHSAGAYATGCRFAKSPIAVTSRGPAACQRNGPPLR